MSESPRRWCGYLLLAVGVVLLAAAAIVFVIAPEGATLEVPIGRRGYRSTETGMWVLFMPAALTLLAAWSGATVLAHPEKVKTRAWWALLFGLGPAIALALLTTQALA